MPKPETPEDFIDKLPSYVTQNQFCTQWDKDKMVAALTARDAAIHAESVALLKMCGEALEASGKSLQEFCDHFACHECPIFSAERHTCSYGDLSTKHSKALAALREAGVM